MTNRTYCTYYKTCKYGDTCPSALTEQVRNRAIEFRQALVQFMLRPYCYKEADGERMVEKVLPES